jgi:chemotaxis protein histidine kinase CheA
MSADAAATPFDGGSHLTVQPPEKVCRYDRCQQTQGRLFKTNKNSKTQKTVYVCAWHLCDTLFTNWSKVKRFLLSDEAEDAIRKKSMMDSLSNLGRRSSGRATRAEEALHAPNLVDVIDDEFRRILQEIVDKTAAKTAAKAAADTAKAAAKTAADTAKAAAKAAAKATNAAAKAANAAAKAAAKAANAAAKAANAAAKAAKDKKRPLLELDGCNLDETNLSSTVFMLLKVIVQNIANGETDRMHNKLDIDEYCYEFKQKHDYSQEASDFMDSLHPASGGNATTCDVTDVTDVTEVVDKAVANPTKKRRINPKTLP